MNLKSIDEKMTDALMEANRTIAAQAAEIEKLCGLIERLRGLLERTVRLSRPPASTRHGISTFLPDDFIDEICTKLGIELQVRS